MPFNFEEYRRDCRSYTNFRLQKEFEKYTRMVSSGTASTGICVGLAPFTFGLSLIGGVAGAASAGNAAKKLSIIEKEMNNRGTHPNLRKRDIFGGYGLGATVGAISHGFGGHLLDSAVHHVVSPTSYTAHCHALKTAEHAADKLGMRGGKAVEKKAYGTVIAARRQYGNDLLWHNVA